MTPCRVCAAPLHPEPLLTLPQMPNAAQALPCADDLAQEHGVALGVGQCSACGLVQLLGAPVPYYREVIRAIAFSPEMQAFRLEQFQAFVAQHALQGKKVVEIGCGRGEYLTLLQCAGVEAHGLEFAAASVRAGRAKGLTLFKGFLPSPRSPLPQAPYAAFFMLAFLEHLPAPHRTLRSLAHHLEPGAVGLVEVPNFDMIVQQGLFSEFIRDHLFYFTQATLTHLLHQNGFEVLACQEVWQRYILSATVRRRTPLDLTPLTGCQAALQRQLYAYLDGFPARRVAVWGAGHQALALLSLLRLGERLAYVVDSAPFKQGRYTPATHLPIHAPERLRSEPVAAVIIMAAGYSDEVAQILLGNYPSSLGVAIVRSHGLELVR